MPSIRDFLEIRTAAPLGFSPDGGTLLVSSNLTGTAQLYTVPTVGGDLAQVTDLSEPVTGRFLPTRDELLLSIDQGGNERLQLHLLTPGSADLRPLVVDPAYIHRAGGITRDGSLLAYTSNRRTGVDFDVWVRDLSSGLERLVFSPGGWCAAGSFSPDGQWLCALRLTEKAGDNDLYVVASDGSDVVHVSPHDDEASYSGGSWLPDSGGFYFSTDEDRDRSALARYELEGRSWSVVDERDWDTGCALDWTGHSLLVVTNPEGFTRAELVDPMTLETRIEVELPGEGVAGAWSFSHDGRSLAYAYSSATEPGDVWVLDVESGNTTRLTDCPKAVAPTTMVAPQVSRFSSFDGERVPVFLYLPRQPAATPPPVVVVVHGGPESQFVPGFNPVVQYLAARGYAVAAPNVRGSTGYGKRWEHLDDVRLRLDTVRDLDALHDWLGTEAAVDADRAVLYGGSYGGYMVLAGLAFSPERWAAGVDIVGISSLVTFLEHTAAWRRKFREREYGSLEHDREFLEEVSPITHVDAMRAPLFIIHGANDPRVPLGEAKQIHDVLTAKGVPCTLLVYEDEGHGLARLANRLDAYPQVADFLDDVLGLSDEDQGRAG